MSKDDSLVAGINRLALLDEFQMRRRVVLRKRYPAMPDFPSLYESGISYACLSEQECSLDAEAILERRSADAEDLAAYRIAELRMLGIDVTVVLREETCKDPSGRESRIPRICLRYQDGTLEDPAEIIRAGCHGP